MFLVPFAIKKTFMKKASKKFAVMVFWTENLLYLISFLMYEAVQCPWIFVRVIYNVIKLATYLQIVPYIALWLIIGPFMLIFGIFKDFFFFVKILCDYQETANQEKEVEEKELNKDKIVLYNEIIDVLRTIMQILIKNKHKEEIEFMKKLGKPDDEIKLKQKEQQVEGDDAIPAYSMKKDMIIEAWVRYRPESLPAS